MGDDTTTIAVVAVAALWIVVALALSVIAARRLARAGSVLDSVRSLASLLEVAPARPLLVRPDGRIEADARLLRELGFSSTPERLDQLAGDNVGFDREVTPKLTGA